MFAQVTLKRVHITTSKKDGHILKQYQHTYTKVLNGSTMNPSSDVFFLSRTFQISRFQNSRLFTRLPPAGRYFSSSHPSFGSDDEISACELEDEERGNEERGVRGAQTEDCHK